MCMYNKLQRDFKIRKHHFISQRENSIMGYTIVSGNKPSPVAINVHQNHAKVFYRNALIKCQIYILNFNMPKTKWDGAEDNSYIKAILCVLYL